MKGSVYVDYLKGMGRLLWAVTWIIISIGYATMVFGDYWLANWVQNAYGLAESESIAVYLGATSGFTILILVGSLLFTIGGYRASQSIHRDTMSRMLQAPCVASSSCFS
jgi:hypothetical protein